MKDFVRKIVCFNPITLTIAGQGINIFTKDQYDNILPLYDLALDFNTKFIRRDGFEIMEVNIATEYIHLRTFYSKEYFMIIHKHTFQTHNDMFYPIQVSFKDLICPYWYSENLRWSLKTKNNLDIIPRQTP